MKYFYLMTVALFCTVFSFAQVNVTATGGTANANYTTLKGAFDAINAGTHTAVITINISASTTESASAILNASGAGGSYLLINMTTTGAPTVSGNIAGPLVQFNGADSVNWDGNNALILSNTNTGGSTLSFLNDATSIVVKNMTIRGATASATSGVVNFGTFGTATTGNDRITLDNCNIDGTGLATTCIWSLGTTTAATNQNSGDTVRNCRIFDFFNTVAAPIAFHLNGGNTGWVITGNSIYHTVNRSTTLQAPMTAMQVLPSWTSDAHTITNNFVGGTSSGANGTFTFSGSAANAVGFIGLNIQTGGPGNLIAGNTIRNVTCTYGAAAGSFGNAGITTFIGGYDGETTIRNNILSNLNITNTAGSALGSGIICNGRVVAAGAATFPTFEVTQNNISNITYSAGGTGNVQYNVIRLETSSTASAAITVTAIANPLFLVDSNTISNISSPSTGTLTFIRGISTINTQGAGAAARLYPLVGAFANNINTISNNSTLTGFASPAVNGIFLGGSTGAINDSLDTHVLSGNSISNLSANSTTEIGTSGIGTVVTGIHVTGGAARIYQNKVFDLKNSAPGATNNPAIIGISVRTLFDTTTIANNFVTLGTGVTNNSTIYGIINHQNTGRLVNVFYNTVRIAGTGAGGNTRGSAALVRDTAAAVAITTPFNVKNNLLLNERTGGSGSNFALILNQAPLTNYSSNYNDFYTGTASPVSYGGNPLSLAAYQAASGQDANSKSLDVNFVNENAGDLHLTGGSVGNINMAGQPLTAGNTGLPATVVTDVVNKDIDIQNRPTVNPYMGADEAVVPIPVTFMSFTATRNGLRNDLSWTTAQEFNSRKFVVERSNNGRDFTVLGEVAASGNSQTPRTYYFNDNNPAKGINYYRINTVDLDMTSRYSIVRSVKNAGAAIAGIYPNPVVDIAQLSIDADKAENARLTIVNMSGAQVHQQSINLVEGNNQFDIDMKKFAKGFYIMTIELNEGQIVQKINKQ